MRAPLNAGDPMGAMDQPEPIEKAGVDELRALQRERLRSTLKHAYENVPHYRKAFDAAGVHPGDLKELADLAKFPFTTKADLRANYPFGMFAVPMDRIVRVHASSGTTGKPTVVGYTKEDIDTWSAVMARSIRAAGGRSSDIVHVAYGYGLFTGGLGAHYGAEALGATVVPVSGGMTERQVQLMCDFKPGILMCTPSYALVIADEFARQGLDPAQCSARVGIFGAEPWSESMRDEIERRLGLAALNHYGLSEVIGPGVASEHVDTRDGLTIWEDHFYPEIIDPQSGKGLPDGRDGELVLTSLTKIGMPVIRFRTRDLTRLLAGTARSMRRMERVTGRSDDMLIIRGVNVFPSQIEEILLKQRLAPHYVLEIRRDGHLDELDVVVERRPETPSPIAQDVERLIKGTIGISTTVRVVEPGTVQRSQGKAVRVIDKRPKV
ncbi:MAG: phenylacetate--CoA ligase [Betaproteobacteria bacterium]|nr:MAG: phenylacetate--CoA ligase [Betaproteobacteria bacterium]TMH92158.1 MAG: phenylacetate--CoA ligase [Betaproteobacteria bacterium]